MVGLPLTLRGEHGLQADETELRRGLREAVEVPVETYDERFTSVLAGGARRGADDAVRPRTCSRATWSGRRAPAPREVGLPEAPPGQRLGALLGVVVGFGLAAAIAWAVVGVGADDGGSAAGERRPASSAAAEAVLRIVFPEGFTRKEMAERVAAVDEIALESGNATWLRAPRTSGHGASPPKRPGRLQDRRAAQPRGLPLPGDVRLPEDTTSPQLVADQLEAFCRAGGRSTSATRARRT